MNRSLCNKLQRFTLAASCCARCCAGAIYKLKFLAVLIFLSTALNAKEFDIHEDVIVEGACPGECCRYQEWRVVRDTILYEEKNVNSGKSVAIASGQFVQALTGDVHVKPTKLVIDRDHGIHKKDEVIWLLNYLGEGYFRAWKEGEIMHVNLPYGPYQEMKCFDEDKCWAHLEGEYRMDWWVKIETKNGDSGWSNQPINFKNKDWCG